MCLFVFFRCWVLVQVFLVVLGRRWMIDDNVTLKEKSRSFFVKNMNLLVWLRGKRRRKQLETPSMRKAISCEAKCSC